MSFHKTGIDCLPSGWIAAPLSEFVDAKSGNSKLIKGKMYGKFSDGLFQGFSASGADVWSDIYEYDTEGVVVSAVGARCGKSFLAKGKWVAIANTHVVIPFGNSLDVKFLWYGINDEEFWVKSGTAQPFVVASKSFERFFAIPPRAEQTRIVEKLEELLSELDAGVAELKAAQKKLVQYRQSLLKAAVEGQLTADWRAQNPPTETGAELLSRILKERRARWEAKQLEKFASQGKTPPKNWQNKYPEPPSPDTQNLPALPEGWVWASVAQLCNIQGGIQKQPSRTPINNKYPFLRVANVLRGELRLDDVHEVELFQGELERLALQIGDVLIVEGNGSLSEIGRCAIWDGSIKDAVHQNHLIRARPVFIRGEWLEAWLNSPNGIGKLTELAATTSGLYTLSITKISRIPVPIPPIDEQREVIQVLSISRKITKEKEDFIAFSLKQTTAQRQNILRAAFAGELVPQDPRDEPASILLERIRAARVERAKQPKPKRAKRKERNPVPRQLIDVLAEADNWLTAQEAFSHCGVTDGASTERIEQLYAELRQLDKAGVLVVEPVHDEQGRKLHDKLKLMKN